MLESRPRFLRNFRLCEIDEGKCQALQKLLDSQPPRDKRKEPKRTCRVLVGDFNRTVDEVLATGGIGEKEAAFALLDQRTFECHWSTVQKLSRHKKLGNKIELFYFLAVKWLHRALSGLSSDVVPSVWWGSDDWQALAGKTQLEICDALTKRFKEELGYKYAMPYPIYEKEEGQGAIMYYMIHASDHDAAPGLMWRAYDKTVTELEVPPEQQRFDL